jgi:hypothetical protein
MVQICHIIVMDLINALPGNSSVNTNTHNNREGGVFSAPCHAVLSHTTLIARQCCGKHISAAITTQQ